MTILDLDRCGRYATVDLGGKITVRLDLDSVSIEGWTLGALTSSARDDLRKACMSGDDTWEDDTWLYEHTELAIMTLRTITRRLRVAGIFDSHAGRDEFNAANRFETVCKERV